MISRLPSIGKHQFILCSTCQYQYCCNIMSCRASNALCWMFTGDWARIFETIRRATIHARCVSSHYPAVASVWRCHGNMLPRPVLFRRPPAPCNTYHVILTSVLLKCVKHYICRTILYGCVHIRGKIRSSFAKL